MLPPALHAAGPRVIHSAGGPLCSALISGLHRPDSPSHAGEVNGAPELLGVGAPVGAGAYYAAVWWAVHPDPSGDPNNPMVYTPDLFPSFQLTLLAACLALQASSFELNRRDAGADERAVGTTSAQEEKSHRAG